MGRVPTNNDKGHHQSLATYSCISLHRRVFVAWLCVWLFAGAEEREKLKENNITHILSIHDTAVPQFPEVIIYTRLCKTFFWHECTEG